MNKFILISLFIIFTHLCTSVLFAQKPVITSVTVQADGAVKIEWLPKTGVAGYVVYRSPLNDNEIYFNPIDTVMGENQYEYIDNSVDARLLSIGYEIKYLDSTLVSLAHFTIFLDKIVYDSCSMTNTITWTKYTGTEISYYNVYVNDTDITTSDLEPDIDTLFRHKVQQGKNLTYEVRAFGPSPFVAGQTILISTSNQASVYTSPIKKPDPNELYFSNIENNRDSVGFTVHIDNTADLLGHSLMVSSNENSGYSEVSYQTMDGSSELQFGQTGKTQPLYYKVNAVGVCGDTVLSSPVVQPIVLNPVSDEIQVTLNWNKSFIQATENYSLTVQVDGGKIQQLTAPNQSPATFVFSDLGTEISEVFCFSLTATDVNNNTSISDEICVSRTAKIDMPNAFNPNSIYEENKYFGPFNSYIKNANIKEFKIIIYDKYGGVIYTSDKPENLWTGASSRTSLKFVPEGAYIYYLWFKTEQNKTYEKSGAINVVYP